MIRRIMLAAALMAAPALLVAQPLPTHAQQTDTAKAAKPKPKHHKKAAAKPAAKDTTKAK
jgi:hypothetical protein